MIKVKSDMGSVELEVHGSLAMICADTTQIVRSIYENLCEKNAEIGERYKKLMTDDLCKLAFKDEESIKDDAIKDVISMLEEVAKMINGSDNDD